MKKKIEGPICFLVAWDQALKITNFITYKWRKIYRGGGGGVQERGGTVESKEKKEKPTKNP